MDTLLALSPLLGRFGWAGIALGLAVRVIHPAGVLFGAIDLGSVAAVVAIVCPLGGLACVVANTVLAYRNSEAARQQAHARGYDRGAADTMKKYGLRPEHRPYRPKG